jgi:hypothetical protein
MLGGFEPYPLLLLHQVNDLMAINYWAMNKKWILFLGGMVLAGFIGATGYQYKVGKGARFSESYLIPSEKLTTEEYIARFDPRAYEHAGTDYFNERYSPLRLRKPLDKIDITYDYDFSYLQQVSDGVANVDRRKALNAIFEKITTGARTDTERHLAVLRFLHKATYHNAWMQPMYADKQAVLDPIVLLELGEMSCGAVARVGADLFEAAGYPTRIVQAVAHTTAEVFYEGDWHLFEAYLAGGGQAPMVDGRIPSVAELSKTPRLIDRVPTHLGHFAQFGKLGYKNGLGIYPSYFFFSEIGFKKNNTKPGYYLKTATPEEAKNSKWYGWNYYTTETKAWKLSTIQPKYEPDPPLFQKVVISNGRAKISWTPALDFDNDLLGYRVYVSRSSRGWQYQSFAGSDAVRPYFRGGWKPEMYDAMYREPPSDAGLISTSRTSVEFSLPPGETRYVTVMAFDRHGESVGRKLYNMTEELTLPR